ncbi:E3 ubiquitin-protein ligase FANCL [Drosophila innubila]|uniref:E3 ubiquitin-protein ligase FANCL n=1 Tax=Drosophila innubila TaxID=198719 RepID=UPI00148C6875|nr:E3 ubiquitin-protein ligase FANCL [Drosophila innubila]XP_034485092.1 E3 ubiquitin-protein ligase FANCL [Drosophila innubila]
MQSVNTNSFIAKFPGLQMEQIKNSAYVIRGVIYMNKKWIRLKLYLPHFPALSGFKLYVQQHLEYKCYNSGNLQIKEDWQLEDLLTHLVQLLPTTVSIETSSLREKNNIYAEILELNKPQEYRLQLDECCSRIRFSNFSEYESHYLELELPSLRLLEYSLPDCISLAGMLADGARSLTDVLNLYLKLLDELRPFYDSFADIDELCDVLQPSPITTKHNSRVFPLKERVYLKVTIADPFASYGSMAVQIIGPTEEVAQLRHVLSDGLSSWDTELDMHKNLLRIFDLCYFPMPAGAELDQLLEKNEEEKHCNICYVYRLDTGEVPLVSCDNPRCVLKCHAACLKEWFDTLIDGKTFLEVSFGLCPFCKAKLSTSFAALLNT